LEVATAQFYRNTALKQPGLSLMTTLNQTAEITQHGVILPDFILTENCLQFGNP